MSVGKNEKAQLCFTLQNSSYEVKHSSMPWKMLSFATGKFELQPSQPPLPLHQQKLKQLTDGLYPKLTFTLLTRNALGTLW